MQYHKRLQHSSATHNLPLCQWLQKLYKKTNIITLVEDKSSGTQVIQLLAGKGVNLVPKTPKGSKEDRVNLNNYLINTGCVYIPSDQTARGNWLPEFIKECRHFPQGRHDDQVDAFIMALEHGNLLFRAEEPRMYVVR